MELTQNEALEILRDHRIERSPEDPRSAIEIATIISTAGDIALDATINDSEDRQ